MRSARNKGRENEDLLVLLFDLENVIININTYCRNKLLSLSKKINCKQLNCVLQCKEESLLCTMERQYDVVSAYRKILNAVFEEYLCKRFGTWSDFVFRRIGTL